MRNLLFILFTGAVLSACNTYSEEEKSAFTSEAENYAKKHHWNYEVLDGGLVVEVLEKGTGTEKIQSGSEVEVSYKGTLTNGRKFDLTEPGKPLQSSLKGLIGGFQLGLLNQVAGTKLRMVIPPHLGYGDDALDKIPANSTLVFEITIEKVI
ncbi:MAG: peptidylprolyl isomerase FKBP-type [Fluviicola sp.]|jgi:FKBP-type peptidyl-prolyl cis-trans isomerase|uniref:FKBP-type peptidyl-prolyl cis-trans isomerase n=1 Tax=Fluviicola sp. TaxID=1917219 RepID=UPI0026144892|nr:FKBP-type peptidyl-prolyl cis-trans isomerase [Fluviicola sp.]MDF3025933.1 peptidylprolyl isomerase FKBP-type [Fluviicola sp.]